MCQNSLPIPNIFLTSILAFLCSFALLSSVACAEGESRLFESSIRTPRYKAGALTPRWGIYAFRISWQGIGAATAWVSLRPKNDQIEVRTIAKTNRFIDLFYKMRFSSYSQNGGKTFLPKTVTLDHQENSRHKTVKIDFVSSTLVKTIKTRNDRPKEVFEFNPQNGMLDPFSAMLLARSLDWQSGQSRNFDIYTGKSRYLVNLRIVGEKVIDVLGKKRNCWIVSPKVKKLGVKVGDKKLRSARLYVTKDEFRELVLLESEVFVGTVKAKLVSFEPLSGTSLKPSHFASAK